MDQAKELAEKLTYGEEFIRLNEEYMNKYMQCETSADVEKMQQEIIDNLQKESDQLNQEREQLEELPEEEEIDYNAIWAKIDAEKEQDNQ